MKEKSITVSKAAPNLFEIRGCTYPHKELLKELGAEWQDRALCWMWKGEKLPTPLQQLADGIYGLEAYKTGVLAVEVIPTPKTPEKPIAPKPRQKTTAKPKVTKPKKKAAKKPEAAKPVIEPPTWETKTIVLATKKGNWPTTADVYGSIAIHRAVDDVDHAFADWVITHVESGYSIIQLTHQLRWEGGLKLRPLAEKLHLIDIKQFWLDYKNGLGNKVIGDQVKLVMSDFKQALEVAEAVAAEGDV